MKTAELTQGPLGWRRSLSSRSGVWPNQTQLGPTRPRTLSPHPSSPQPPDSIPTAQAAVPPLCTSPGKGTNPARDPTLPGESAEGDVGEAKVTKEGEGAH